MKPCKLGVALFMTALLFGCSNLPKANLDDHDNIIAEYAVNKGQSIVTRPGYGYHAYDGSEVKVTAGSQVTAEQGSVILACSGSAVTASPGSTVHAAVDAKVDARGDTAHPGPNGDATVVVGDIIDGCQIPSHAAALGGVTAGAGARVYAFKGAVVHALAGATVFAYAGSSVQAEPGSTIHALAGSDVYYNTPDQNNTPEDESD